MSLLPLTSELEFQQQAVITISGESLFPRKWPEVCLEKVYDLSSYMTCFVFALKVMRKQKLKINNCSTLIKDIERNYCLGLSLS